MRLQTRKRGEKDRRMEREKVRVSDGAAAVVAVASVYMKQEEGEMHLGRDLPNGGEAAPI